MNQKLRKFLEANGLRAEATEQEAWELYDKLKGEGIDLPGIDPGQRSAPQGAAPAAAGDPAPATGEGASSGLDPDIQARIDAASREAARQARQEQVRMVAAIDEHLQVARLSDADNGEFRRSILNDENMTLERATQMIFERMKKDNPPLGIGTQVGTEAPEKLRAAITDGLLLRSGHRLDEPADGAKEFRGRHMVEICREVLESAGQSTRGLDKRTLVGRALASGSTSDFPLILGALVNKSLLKAYTEWPQTWRPFVAVGTAVDFKQMFALKLSGAPDLLPMNENGEYRTASFSDAGENYRVQTRGRIVALTREMIINDDLRAFTRIPQLFGTAAKRMEGDAVYNLITANGNMSDGNAFLSAAHNNVDPVPAVINSDTLGLGRAGMRSQTGLNGEALDIQPSFLLTPVVLETTAEVLLRSATLPNANTAEGDYNPWAGKLTPIADPHLDANSPTAWYLLAHPNQAPVIEVAWLEGEEQPYVEEMVDFHSDAVHIKVRHDFGAGVVDHVGAWMNAGL